MLDLYKGTLNRDSSLIDKLDVNLRSSQNRGFETFIPNPAISPDTP